MPLTVHRPLEGAAGSLDITPYTGNEIREGGRYAYRFVGVGCPVASIEPTELFRPRPDDTDSGDFLPQQCVGTVDIACRLADGRTVRTAVEVRPAKLEAETEYRAMLDQLADHAAEAVLQGFAPSALAGFADTSADAATAYRTLAFLSSRLRDETFQAALHQVRHRPHHGWQEITERRHLGAGHRASARIARGLIRAESSMPTPGHLAHLPVPSVPASIDSTRTESTYDTPPNRFLRYVLSRWQAIALDVLTAVRAQPRMGPGPRGRGEAEARWVADLCEEMLADVPLRDAGPMGTFPASNQVLLRRPGYREILRAFALAETTMALEADLPDDPFSATQRNVAALYEYWCFAALTSIVSTVADSEPAGLLFEPSATGLNLVLRQGEASRLSWEMQVDGRVLLADLWFNRSFERTDDPGAEIGSWARRLRPDASLRIRPKSARPRDAVDPELDVWVHFDAKYRIESITVDAPVDDLESNGDESGVHRRATRDDLLKMHAYRDAIRRSAGAYVLYPGDGTGHLQREFHEVLPGLGAFPLRPLPGGRVAGAEALETFVHEVARHVANQASAMERTQYWSARYNRRAGRRVRPVDFLARPPADTLTLVGYARAPQIGWVLRTKQYNLRADGRRGAVDVTDDMLRAGLVVIWTGDPDHRTLVGAFERVGPWQVATADDLSGMGYPGRDRAARYLVTPIEPLPVAAERAVRRDVLDDLRTEPFGAPTTLTWEQLSSSAP